ncbi:hypothetical protein GCM10023260_10770 [Bartonella acomydis]|uniref:Uncharacterized protein n=1 Tax=Bartonella acomydis TaxID=686234 RepID=A0ABP9MRW4_9HYPH
MKDVFGTVEVVIAKQCHEPIGTAHLTFQFNFTRFNNLTYNDNFPEKNA